MKNFNPLAHGTPNFPEALQGLVALSSSILNPISTLIQKIKNIANNFHIIKDLQLRQPSLSSTTSPLSITPTHSLFQKIKFQCCFSAGIISGIRGDNT